jgi:hypothetical protein
MASNRIAVLLFLGVADSVLMVWMRHDFDVERSPRIWCLLYCFITLATGACPGVVTYLLAWIIVPEEPELKPVVATQQPVTS